MLSRFKKKDREGSFLRAARSGNLEKLIALLNKKIDINVSDQSGLTALHLAAKEGQVAVVKELLRRGARVDAQTKKKNTPLHMSCLAGRLESIRMLADNGANVNAQSMNGFTPLYMAAQEGHVDVVKFLVTRGADASLSTDDGYTPLSVALQQNHGEVVRLLMEHGSSSSSSSPRKRSLSALHLAAKNNDAKAVRLLLQHDGIDCNKTTRSGFTPLHIASHYGHVDIGLALIQQRADVDAKTRNGISPLHVASKRGHLEMVKLLTSSGADPDSRTMDGMTPLHCAAKSGHHQVIRHLLDKGAKVNSKTRHGLAPLHSAAQADSAESCKVLLNNKAAINEGTVDNLTPLHVASHFGCLRSGRLLLEKRCDVDARTKAGFTPLHVAITRKKSRMVELLLRFGANLDAQTARGLSPMHLAALTGSSPIAASLLQAERVNVNLRTSRGDTPLHLATRGDHIDIVGALLQGGAQVDVKGTEHRLTPLHVSSQLGHPEVTSMLLGHGSDPDSKTSEMMTPLHLAASKNGHECAAHLLDHGANADIANKSGYTPLHTAIKHNSIEVARLLRDRGVSMEVEGSNGIKPLHVATRYNHLESLQLLLEAGALANCRAHNGYTPLHVAAQENRINAAKSLLNRGAEVNALSKTKVTPLHLACKEGHDKFAKLLLDKGAHVTSATSSSLTPVHYAAISGKPELAELLMSSGAEATSLDNNGNTPLHLACYHGRSSMVSYLLNHGADPNVVNKLGMTPLHYSAQNGDLQSVNSLLNSGAEPNTLSDSGWSPLCIAQRNGYGELASLLLPLTLDRCLYFPDDLDRAGSDVDCAQSFVFDSPYPRAKVLINLDQVDLQTIKELPIDFDDNDLFELDKLDRRGSVTSLGAGVTEDDLRYIRDGEEISFSSYAGLNSEIRNSSPLSARPTSSLSSRPNSPSFNNFLVSFMVDARGGSMYGQRHSGVSVFVPPGCASSPVRVTCRYLAPEKLRNPPPLLPEGEDLACRVIEMGPKGQKFLGPVTLNVPHYASLREGAREIVIMRSDDGKSWTFHEPPPAREAVEREMDASEMFPDDLFDTEKQHVSIVTDTFPVYFALVSRPKRHGDTVGSEGGLLTSPLNRDVQIVVPSGSVKRETQVQLQVINVPDEVVDFEFGGKARVSPVVVIEPKRRKFHTPVTVKIPLPKQKATDECTATRLLCSVSGDNTTSKWEDITDKTPMTILDNCAAFLTSISASYWLVRIKQTNENWLEKIARVQQEASAVPFLAQFVVLGRRTSQREGNFRIFCVTEDRADKIKDAQRNREFEEIAKSQEVEVLQGKPLYLESRGDFSLVKKHQGDPPSLVFHSLRENRLPVRARLTEDFVRAWLEGGMLDQPRGRFLFRQTPCHLTPESQTPVCSLEVYMPQGEGDDVMRCSIGTGDDSLEIRTGGSRAEEHISKAELRLTDIADSLDTDWIPLALQLGLTPHDVGAIQSDYDFLPEQALVMLHTWVQRNGDRATGNTLEKALKQIKREDVLSRCMYNIRQVTDVHEMAVAKEFLDAGIDGTKDYLGSGLDVASSRGSSMQRGTSLDRSYGEHASFKDTSLFDSGSESASIIGKDEFGKGSHDKLKIHRGSDRFIYMDGSKSPSNLTMTPSESDVEFLPTADVCDLDAGVEYELEEIWDGTRWKCVRNAAPGKVKALSREDLQKKSEDAPQFTTLTVAGSTPAGRITPIVDVSDTDLPVTSHNDAVIVDEPDDETHVSSVSFRSRQQKAPPITDITDSVEVSLTTTETSLTSVKEEEDDGANDDDDDDERERTPVIDVLEDQDYRRTTEDAREERLEDGSTVRHKTQTVQTVRPVVEKHYAAGRWREERKELIVGEEVHEEILELAPGVNVEHGTDLQSETTVEEFNETLPNGAWVKKKVLRIKVTRKRSPARTIASPWGDAILPGRKTAGAAPPAHVSRVDSPAGVEKTEKPFEDRERKVQAEEFRTETVAKKVEDQPSTTTAPFVAEIQSTSSEETPSLHPSQTSSPASATEAGSTEAGEKFHPAEVIESPVVTERQETMADGTILLYKTVTRKVVRPRTRRVVRDGSIIETITEHELVETRVEDEITELSPGFQAGHEGPVAAAERSILSVEEFEERQPDNSLLKRKITRTTLKHAPNITPLVHVEIPKAVPDPALTAKDQTSGVVEAGESRKDLPATSGKPLPAEASQSLPQSQEIKTEQVSEDRTERETEPQKSEVSIPSIEDAAEVVQGQKHIVKEDPSHEESKNAKSAQRPLLQEKTVAITELSPEEESVNILTPVDLSITPQTMFKTRTSRDHQQDVSSGSPAARKRGTTFLHISPVPAVTVGQVTPVSSPSSPPISGSYELPPVTETLGVQEWEDIKSDGTRQCFKIVTKRKMRPVAVMRPSPDGVGFVEKIIKKEKIGVEIDEEITEIAPNVVLEDDDEDLDKTTSIDEFHETAGDGTWVKRKVRRTEIKRSEDAAAEEFLSEDSESSTCERLLEEDKVKAEEEEVEAGRGFERESFELEQRTSREERVEFMTSERLETVGTSDDVPVAFPRMRKQEIPTAAHSQVGISAASTSVPSPLQLHRYSSSGVVEEKVDPVLGNVTVIVFADQPRVDEREETDSDGGRLRYKILTRTFKRRIYKKAENGSERLLREENVGTEVEEHIEETEAGLRGDDEVGVERKTSEDEFNETMPDGTWLRRKVSHAKIYRKRRADDQTQLPTPVRSPKIGSKFHSDQQKDRGTSRTEPKVAEREEVSADGTRLKFKVTSHDHVVRVGSNWKRLGTEVVEEIVEISPEVASDSDEFTDKVTSVTETEDVLPDGSWIKRKVVHVKVTKRPLLTEAEEPVSRVGLTESGEARTLRRIPQRDPRAPDYSEFKELANVEEHEEQKEDGTIVSYKKTTKKCLRPVTELATDEGEIVERVSREVEIGTLILEETIEYEPGLVPDYTEYTEEQKKKVSISAVCDESSQLLPDNTWLKRRHDVIKVEWNKNVDAGESLNGEPEVASRPVQVERQQPRPAVQVECQLDATQTVATKKEIISTLVEKTTQSEKEISAQDVQVQEKGEKPVLNLTALDGGGTILPGEHVKTVKSATTSEESIRRRETEETWKKDEIALEEESVEETDLDEILDQVTKVDHKKVIHVVRKEEKSDRALSTASQTFEREIIIPPENPEGKKIEKPSESQAAVPGKSHAEMIFLKDAPHEQSQNKPVSDLPAERKPGEVKVVEVKESKEDSVVEEKELCESIETKEDSRIFTQESRQAHFRISEQKETIRETIEKQTEATEKLKEMTQIAFHGQETSLVSNEITRQGVSEPLKPQHLEEYTFDIEEKTGDYKTDEQIMDEKFDTIKTPYKSHRLQEQKLIDSNKKEVLIETAVDKLETEGEKIDRDRQIVKTREETASIVEVATKPEELPLHVVTTNTEREEKEEKETISVSGIEIEATSRVIENTELVIDVTEPKVAVETEVEVVNIDERSTFALAVEQTVTETAEIPLTITEDLKPKSTSVESKVEESKPSEISLKADVANVHTSEVEKVEFLKSVAPSTQETETVQRQSKDVGRTTEFKVDTAVVVKTSIDVSPEPRRNEKISISEDVVKVLKQNKVIQSFETTKSEEISLDISQISSESTETEPIKEVRTPRLENIRPQETVVKETTNIRSKIVVETDAPVDTLVTEEASESKEAQRGHQQEQQKAEEITPMKTVQTVDIDQINIVTEKYKPLDKPATIANETESETASRVSQVKKDDISIAVLRIAGQASDGKREVLDTKVELAPCERALAKAPSEKVFESDKIEPTKKGMELISERTEHESLNVDIGNVVEALEPEQVEASTTESTMIKEVEEKTEKETFQVVEQISSDEISNVTTHESGSLISDGKKPDERDTESLEQPRLVRETMRITETPVETICVSKIIQLDHVPVATPGDSTLQLSGPEDRFKKECIEETTLEEITPSPVDEKFLQFQMSPGTFEGLSFEFHPVVEQMERAEIRQEPDRNADLPHVDFTVSPDISPFQSEEDLYEPLVKEKLENYEKILRSLEQVLEGHETEIDQRAPINMVRAILRHRGTDSSKDSSKEAETQEVETPAERPQSTSFTELLQKFLVAKEQPQMVEDFLSLSEEPLPVVFPERRTSQSVPCLSDSDTATADYLPEEVSSSILEYFEASGILLEEKIISVESSESGRDEGPTSEELKFIDARSETLLEGLTKSVIEHFEHQQKEGIIEPTSIAAMSKESSVSGLQAAVPQVITEPVVIPVERSSYTSAKETEDDFDKTIRSTTEIKSEIVKEKIALEEKSEDATKEATKEIKNFGEVERKQIDLVVTDSSSVSKNVTSDQITIQILEKQLESTSQKETTDTPTECSETRKATDETVSHKSVIQALLAEAIEEKDKNAQSFEVSIVEEKFESIQEQKILQKSSKEKEIRQEIKRDELVRVESIQPADVTVETRQVEELKVTERTTKDENESHELEKPTKIPVETTQEVKSIEDESQHEDGQAPSATRVDAELVVEEQSTKASETSLLEGVKQIEVTTEIVEKESREEGATSDRTASVTVDSVKTTVATSVATHSSVTTSIVTTTSTTTVVSTAAASASTVAESFLTKIEEAKSTRESLSTSDSVESSETVKSVPEQSSEKKTAEATFSFSPSTTATAASIASKEGEEGVTYKTVEGDVKCRVEESEKHELSEDGKKSVTKKTMTRNYYQTHIRNKIKGGIIVAVQPVETYVGRCVDECIFESSTDISDPYSADVETTTSIDESEETLDDGTWVKRKVTTVVAYLAHEELDSPSIFLDAVTLPKSPRGDSTTQEETYKAEKREEKEKKVPEDFGLRFPEFFQSTANVDNVKMRIIRLGDSKPKLHERRKTTGVKAAGQSAKPDQQMAAEAKPKREGKPPSFVLPETRSTKAGQPTATLTATILPSSSSSRQQTDATSTASTDRGSKRLLRSRVRRTITRKIRKVLHSGEIVEDVVTEEIPDVEMSETSSVRSGHSDVFDFMSPLSSSVASIASPSDLASPRRRKGSASSHSSLRIHTDTVEGQPEVTTEVQEREETLPDGRVIVRKVIKTRQKQTIVKRVVLDEEGDDQTSAGPDADLEDPAALAYAELLLHRESDSAKRSTASSVRGQTSYVDEWLQQAVAASGEVPPSAGFEPAVVVSRIRSAGSSSSLSSKPKYRVSMERTDTTASASAVEERSKKSN